MHRLKSIICITLISIFGCTYAASDDMVYQVDVILFAHKKNLERARQNGNATVDYAQDQAIEIEPDNVVIKKKSGLLRPAEYNKAKVLTGYNATKPQFFQNLISKNKTAKSEETGTVAEKFNKAANNLANNSDYAVLYRASWQQPAKQLQPVLLSNIARDDKGSDFNFESTITLKQLQQLHIRADVFFYKNIFRDNSSGIKDFYQYLDVSSKEDLLKLAGEPYHLYGSRKIGKDSTYYFDHPYFGLLVGITPMPYKNSVVGKREEKASMAKEKLPEGFVYLDDSRIFKDLVYTGKKNFLGRRVAGYSAGAGERCIATTELAQALIAVQDELSARHGNYFLKIYDAYRPMSAVRDFMQWAQTPETEADRWYKQRYYPDLSRMDLFKHGYILERSAHSRGSAVDLTIVVCNDDSRLNCQDLDMGTRFDFFGPASHSDYSKLSVEAEQNRRFLQELMGRHGFSGIREEWWHFNLGQEPFPDTYFDFPVG